MPPARRVPDMLRSGPFAYPAGVGSVGRGRLRGPSYRRLTRGVYQFAGLARGYPEKIQAMRLVVPPDAVLAGLGAAWAHGALLARPADPVEFVTGRGRIRCRPGLQLRADQLRPDEIVMTSFGPATGPQRTAFDLARAAAIPRAAVRPLLRTLRGEARLGAEPPSGPALFGFPDERTLGGESAGTASRRLVVAVSQVDALLRAKGLKVSVLSAMIERHAGARGVWSARLVAALADPRADSPPESVLRVRVVLAGLPRPVPQYEIFDVNDIFVAKPDLGWPELLLGAEYDGAYHEGQSQVRKDRKRDIRGHRVRWRLLHFDSSSSADVPALIRDTHTVMLQQLPYCQHRPEA